MMRRLLLTALALMPLTLPGLASASTSKPMLDESALGSMLMLTQRRVETGQFQQVGKFVPAVTDYLEKAGGGEVAAIMKGALR